MEPGRILICAGDSVRSVTVNGSIEHYCYGDSGIYYIAVRDENGSAGAYIGFVACRSQEPHGEKKQDITIENNELEIQGGVEPYNPEKKELKYSEFTQYDYYRKFYVGNDINRDKINATLENGVLPLVL
ncbi:MAG: hypothetical protein A2176_14405 [Spirochaetes bacterium RBG_13_51_14]|nr:MAG: hypothetical protein A2176_14405 [Spirochaetes bacterium RBG_13_51_14]